MYKRQPDTSWVYVDVGLGFHAQMTPAEAIAFSTQRESKLTEAAEALARCGEQPPRASSQIQHTPFQRQIKLWAASGQWAEMLWLARHTVGHASVLLFSAQALTQRAAKLKAQIKLTIGAIDEILAGRGVQGR